MSSSIDTKVVEMKMDNASFLRGIASTLAGLKDLQKNLNMKGAAAGLNEVNKAANSINVGHIADGVKSIASRFSALGIVGVTALASIATQAVATGAAMIKSLTVKPLMAGLQEYETNLNSIQTILANTGLEGQKGLDQVNAALNDLNHYSDQTIYNFSEMARNIGTFTAAGIKLEPATAAIKGIANLAAISGSSAEQASSAMYQLSQAMAAGKATLVDWNSVVNAGMGGKVFQEALKETARVQGIAVDDIIKKNGSFRDSLQEGWLTTEVLTATLQKFTGDMNAQQLKSLGYTDAQIKAIMKMGKTAQDAATKVKTISQLINTLQEAAGSGWAKTFQLMFGDFEEARTLFTNVNNVLGGFIQNSANARNQVLSDWKALGGRKVLIEGIAIAFNNVMDVLTPIRKAFRDIFPPATGKQLYQLTVGFRDLMANLRLNEGTMDNIRRTFRGVFAIFSIGISILKGIGTTLKTVFQSFEGGGSGILEFTGNIGDWLVALDKAIKSGKGFHDFFVKLGNVIRVPIEGLKAFIGMVADVLSGTDDLAAAGAKGVAKFAGAFNGLDRIGKAISKVWSGIITLLKAVFKVFEPLVDLFSSFFTNLGDQISNSFASADYSGILDSINTGLLGGIALLIAKFLKGGINLDLGGGVLESIKDAFGGLTGVMSAMQAQLKANALIKIAAAIALLTASVVALSLIDSKKLASALSALSVMFTQLLVAMNIFGKIVATKGFLKLPFLTVSMIALAIAIDLLTIAVARMAKLNWEQLAKGLTGTAALLTALGLFTKFSGTNVASGASLILLAVAINLLAKAAEDLAGLSWGEIVKGLVATAGLLAALALFTKLSAANKGGIAQGAGLVLLAAAIKVLASAMEDLGKLSWKEIAKGLVTMAGGLAIMGTALALVPPSSVLSAAAIFVVAASLGMIGDAVKKMGDLSWGEIAKGLTTMAGALTAISLAIGLLPPSSLLSAAAIFVVAASLGMIGDALGQMGDMTWEEIAKGLVTLAGSLTLIAAAMYVMTGALPGAAATLVVAAAMKLLAPVLMAFGEMKWSEIAKGLVMLAGVFVVFGVAGLALAPLVPVLLALGIAIAAMGVGMLAAGAGMALFGVGLTAVSVAGSAAVAVLIGAVRGILGLLPDVVTALGDTVTAFAKAITKAAPAVTEAIVTVLMSILNAIIRLSPKIAQTLGVLLALMLSTIMKYAPKLADAGLKLLIALLTAISNNIGKVVKVATDVIVNFINAIAKNQPRIVDAGAKMIISFINGVADAIRNNSSALGAAGGNLAAAIIQGMASGLTAGIGEVASRAADVAKNALNAAKNALGINSPSKEFIEVGKNSDEGLALGLTKFATVVAKSADGVGKTAISSLQDSLSGISDVVTTDANFNPVIRPVLDLTDVEKKASDISKLLAANPMSLDTSFNKAKDASVGYANNLAAQQTIDAERAEGAQLNYTQINTSPKALNSVEIYRQTNNQLSTVKEALKK